MSKSSDRDRQDSTVAATPPPLKVSSLEFGDMMKGAPVQAKSNEKLLTRPEDVRPASIFWDGRRKVAFGMVSPGFVILLLLAVGPMLFMFVNAFKSWNLTVPAPAHFVGLRNFTDLLADSRFGNAFLNTIMLMVTGIAVQSLIGLAIAMLLRNPFKLRSVVMGFLLIPVLVAPVAIGLNWKLIFNDTFGPLNYLLTLIGMKGPLWLSSNRFWALLSVLIVDSWQWIPFVALVFLAGLESIPGQVYEAADVDGAKPLMVFFRVTLPLLRPMFVLIVLLRTIFIFRIFDPVFILTNGGPGTDSETLSLLTFTTGVGYFDIGHAMAMGVLQILFMVILANLFLKFVAGNKKKAR
jgi:multiple sugar transport system permease protein